MTPPVRSCLRRAAAATTAIAALSTLTGCLERTIAITSKPSGALVYLNDIEIGRTPVETDFTYFGTYDVRLHLDGYEPLVTSRTAEAPLYELPGIDLVAEAIPSKIDTRIEWNFVLTPLPELKPGADKAALDEQLINRARELRSGSPDKPEKSDPPAQPAEKK